MNNRNDEGITRMMRNTCLGLLATIAAACGATADKTPPSPTAERIGTYDGRAVAIAYANSDLFRQWLDGVRKEHDAAAAAGDTKRAAEFEAKAVTQQERFHGQAFGGDDIDDILERVAAQLPAIRAQAGVARLEAINQPRPADAATVDVTDAIVALFHPDDRAKGWIADIRGKPFPKR
ncbi:MAG: hypothetical protein H6838_18850 [Planctomycetes bacterium]|nr:hypothetical protein [Planctomycetota bacterium]MCB9887557.1 hypothetical protein [Planctomycetota bacterium]